MLIFCNNIIINGTDKMTSSLEENPASEEFPAHMAANKFISKIRHCFFGWKNI